VDRYELLATLNAYRAVKEASWPALIPSMKARAPTWPDLSTEELEDELAGYVLDSDAPSVRVFWKMGNDFVYRGCNERFARDAGLARAADIVGLTDFDDKLAWVAQAAKYRRDDRDVYQSGVPKLDILERQSSSTGVIWLRTGKAPIQLGSGATIGVFGMYEVIDDAAAAKLNLAQVRRWRK
jgi:hypothetical protein